MPSRREDRFIVKADDGVAGESLAPPSVTFETLTFSDGTPVSLEPSDIVVFVGPNNAGKSLALRELNDWLPNPNPKKVLTQVKWQATGSEQEFRDYFLKHSSAQPHRGRMQYSGYRFGFTADDPAEFWPERIGQFPAFFCLPLWTETRITDSNPVEARPFLEEAGSHPIHLLYLDGDLEARISAHFKAAFESELIVYPLGGSQIPLRVGTRPATSTADYRRSKAHAEALQQASVMLHEQGDGMRSFASVLLHVMAPETPSIILLDEPEAFLHPPQQRALGEMLANEASRGQLFVATHSPDIVHGLVTGASDRIRILRMERDGDVNRVRQLDPETVHDISIDPMMKYSAVLDGLFHGRVIVCEGESDCMFYDAILQLEVVRGPHEPDVRFIHANGKSRMPKVVKALRALGVPIDVIVDMDIIGTTGEIKRLFEELGGRWEEIEESARIIKESVERTDPPLSMEDLKKGLVREATRDDGNGTSKELERQVKALFKRSSSWAGVRTAGQGVLKGGEITGRWRQLRESCRRVGLWLVPVGELESFCKDESGSKAEWVQRVLEDKGLAKDDSLEDARTFIREVWHSRDKGVTGAVPPAG